MIRGLLPNSPKFIFINTVQMACESVLTEF